MMPPPKFHNRHIVPLFLSWEVAVPLGDHPTETSPFRSIRRQNRFLGNEPNGGIPPQHHQKLPSRHHDPRPRMLSESALTRGCGCGKSEFRGPETDGKSPDPDLARNMDAGARPSRALTYSPKYFNSALSGRWRSHR